MPAREPCSWPCPDHARGRVPHPFHLAGQAEIGDLGHAFGRQEHVGRLQVPVDDAAAVSFVDGPGEGSRQLDNAGDRLRLAVDLLGQRAAADKFQHQVRQPVLPTHLEDLHDVRMVQPGRRFRLDAEPHSLLVAGVFRGADHLDGHQPVERQVAGLVDNPHAAAPQDLEHVVPGDLAAQGTAGGRQRHRAHDHRRRFVSPARVPRGRRAAGG